MLLSEFHLEGSYSFVLLETANSQKPYLIDFAILTGTPKPVPVEDYDGDFRVVHSSPFINFLLIHIFHYLCPGIAHPDSIIEPFIDHNIHVFVYRCAHHCIRLDSVKVWKISPTADRASPEGMRVMII
jgi:hypothetical protein